MTYDITDYVAWWGAILATAVLCWDIYKHLSSKAIIMVRTTTMVHPYKSIEVEVSNIGTKSTTITKVYMHEVPGFVIDKESGECMSIPSGGTRYQLRTEERFKLPYMLSPGAVWNGHIDPAIFESISRIDKMMIKVRDERGVKVARSIVSIPNLWRNNRILERSDRMVVSETKSTQ